MARLRLFFVEKMNNEAPPFLKGFRALRIPVLDKDGNSAWPELFTLDKIMSLRDAAGQRHFSAQMMLEYISEENAWLNPESLIAYDNINEFKITGSSLYWDPSSGTHKSDGSACAFILRDDSARRAFIHDIKYFKANEDDLHPMATQCSQALDFMLECGARTLSIEVNGMGGALPEILRNLANLRGQSVIITKITNRESKTARIINSIEPLLDTGRLYINSNLVGGQLWHEFSQWDVSANLCHDDGLDAVAGALRVRPVPVRPAARPITAQTEFSI